MLTSAGIKVTALVRRADSLPAQTRLTIVEGTPLKEKDLEQAIAAASTTPTILVSTLGQTRKSGNPFSATTSPPGYMSDSIKNALASGKAHGMKKVVAVSMFGAGDSLKNLNVLMRSIMTWSNMKQTVEDHNLVNEAVKECGLPYVLIRPAMLKGDQMTEVKDLGDNGEKAKFLPSISPNMVASFLVDAVESDTWNGRTPVISV